jgi:hypothetical protein
MENQLENLGLVAKPWVIYALADPREPNLTRYVGKTQDTNKRLREHLCEARMGKRRDHRLHWLRKLASCSVEPVISILETGKGDGWKEAERKWIKHFRDMGARLVNGTDGGEGVDLTPEIRAKMLAAMRSPEHRAKISAALRRRHYSLETRAKMSSSAQNRSPEVQARLLDIVCSQERRAKLLAANIGRHPSAETRAKISASKVGNQYMLGRHHTEETRAKLSAAAIARSCSLEYRAKLSVAARNRSSETRAKMSAARKAYLAKKRETIVA